MHALLAFVIFFLQSYRQEVDIELGHMKSYNRQLSMDIDRVVDPPVRFDIFIFQMIKSGIYCAAMIVTLTRRDRKRQRRI